MKMPQHDINTSVNAVKMYIAIPANINLEYGGESIFLSPIQSHEINQAWK